jgi:hypothetical protein
MTAAHEDVRRALEIEEPQDIVLNRLHPEAQNWKSKGRQDAVRYKRLHFVAHIENEEMT